MTIPEPPWWTPRKTTAPRRSLSREGIVGAALAVLRAEGIDALSMRRVAAELGTGAASLYAHVAHKDELLEFLFDEVMAEIALPEPDPARWREQVTQLWVDTRTALARNGDIARVALGRVPVGPNAMRVTELAMTMLRFGGIPDQAVAWAVDVIGLYVSASAIEGSLDAERQRGGTNPAEFYAQMGRYFATLPADRLPVTALLAPVMAKGNGDERFRFGLDLMIRGLGEAD